MRSKIFLSLTLALLLGAPDGALAEICPADQFRKVVDDAGAALRRVNTESRPRIDSGLRRLKDKFGWSEDDYTEKANALLSDAKSEGYDVTASELLARLDRLSGEGQSGKAECGLLADLESTALELQATVRVKTQYMLSRIDATLADQKQDQKQAAASPTAVPAPSSSPAAPAPQKAPPAQSASPPQAAPKTVATLPTSPAAKAPTSPKTTPSGSWSTTSKSDPLPRAETGVPPASQIPSSASAPPPAPPMPPLQPANDGFSADEIKEASRGFFGTISSGLAGVIEHAFSKLGRPTAYVLGNEGGGAFIAGVRYGSGTLFTRGGKSREVYWHGPSIGYDFGASGSKALFLVYNMRDELDIFDGFSGVDGSAYLVGGVGMTVLTNGHVVMAPIRSGVGLRLGASIGYVRFTPRATWNPF